RVTSAQVDAWRRMADLCREQADQLERAMKQLLQRWPAQPGSASAAFSGQVTALVASMRKTAEAAAANQEPLNNITYALTSARVEIGALVETRWRYTLTEQQLTPQPTPSPGQIPVPAAPAGLQPPPPNWRTRLEQQARTIMAHTDTTVGTEATRIQTPPEYVSRMTGFEIEEPPPGGDGDGSGSVGTKGTSRPTFDLIERTGQANVSVPPLISGGGGRDGGDEGVGPILSGGAIPATPATGVLESLGRIGGVASGGSISGSFVTTPLGAVLAPGGTIGPRASTPAAQTPSHIPAGRTSTSQAPTGAGGGTASRVGTQGTMPMAPMVPPMSGRPGAGTSGLSATGRPGRGGRQPPSQTDPDDPWAVAQGGPAVLEPLPEPTEHDPGPGVIGLDR
ncbi:MAG: hypothetical protein QOE61_4714, partial [Micromonosporaceae bacterium]|nr:hypothetical protein [Micromonosporaceae bacterium]